MPMDGIRMAGSFGARGASTARYAVHWHSDSRLAPTATNSSISRTPVRPERDARAEVPEREGRLAVLEGCAVELNIDRCVVPLWDWTRGEGKEARCRTNGASPESLE